MKKEDYLILFIKVVSLKVKDKSEAVQRPVWRLSPNGSFV